MKSSANADLLIQITRSKDGASSALCPAIEADGFVIGIVAYPEAIPLSRLWTH
jgi:hypothetical protein